jgi:uncharacterized protein (TIGR00661 family)
VASILYGVNGEGSGHSTRAKEVISHLRSRGHAVHIASFDRGLRNLSEDFPVTEIYGFRFAYVNNQVRYRRTIAKNLATLPKAAASVRQLIQLAEARKTQVVITDFEPLCCQVAYKIGLPLISIDNQHCLTNTDVTPPKHSKSDAAVAKLVTRMMVPRANSYLVTSFFSAKVRKKNTFLFAPILRQEILRAAPREGARVLVYVTSPAPELAQLLSSIRSPFTAYGFGREGQAGNVLFKKPSLDGFLHDLTDAKAIVANAGFSLVTESLHLGKPYLAVPVKHQFEQIFNAYWLDKMGYGAYWPEINKERVESFLYNLPHYRENLAGYPRKGNAALLAKLDSLIGEYASRSARGEAQ